MMLISLLQLSDESLSAINLTLRKRCQYSKLFWSAFSHIHTEYEEIFSPWVTHLITWRKN